MNDKKENKNGNRKKVQKLKNTTGEGVTSKFNNRRSLLAAIGGGVSFGLAGCLGNGNGDNTLTIGYQPICAQYWTELIQKHGGLAEKWIDGYDIQWESALTGGEVGNRMISGQNQIGYNGDMPAILMMKEDVPIDMIGLSGWSRGQQCNNLLVSDHTNINTVDDLDGEEINVTFGTCTHSFVLELIEEEGLDVDLVDLGINEILSNARDDGITAFGAWEPNASISALQNDNADYLATGVTYGVPDCGTIEMTREFYEEDPEAVKGFLKAELEAQHIMETDPEQTIDYVEQETEFLSQYDRSTLEDTLYQNISNDPGANRFNPDANMRQIQPIEQLLTEDAPQFLIDQGFIDESPAEDSYRFDVLEEAADELENEVDWDPHTEPVNN